MFAIPVIMKKFIKIKNLALKLKIGLNMFLFGMLWLQLGCGSNDTVEINGKSDEFVEDSNEDDDNQDPDSNEVIEDKEDDDIQDTDSNPAPSENFDLSTWNLSIPTDADGNNKADTISEHDLNAKYQNEAYFYTADDGGMVFKCPVDGFKTSENTKYTRSELREMLRAGNTNISTQGITKNNWVFGSAPQNDIENAGGYDGDLNATLAVNYVTTTGDSSQVGRAIIGQIHANDDEPLRIYYRKLPGNELGAIYIAHEGNALDEDYYEMIGSRTNSASNPPDGIALNEKFSYSVKVVGNEMWVEISREGKETITQYVDMSASNYDVGGQYMYFKAGVYNQNNSGLADDYVQATFYNLSTSHSN